MDFIIVIQIVLIAIIWIPLIIVLISYGFLKRGYDISFAYAKSLGFLISINGPIRSGKTSFQSGLKHLIEIIIENNLLETIDTTRKIYRYLDFTIIDAMMDDLFQTINKDLHNDQIIFDNLLEQIFSYLKTHHIVLDHAIINNVLGNKTSKQLFEEYIFSYYVYYYRRNYVQSKTIFYSHVTQNMSYDYNVFHNNIHDAYLSHDYAIYDYMLELIDEASDEIGANKRYDDIKEEGGDKDYRRKFGQIHQERNWQIITKQDVKDEKKKLRSLTQSNIWLPVKVEQRGTHRLFLKILKNCFNIVYFFYIRTFVFLRYIYSKIRYKYTFNFQEFQEQHYKLINFKRHIDNFILHIDWFLKASAYNKYEIRVYQSEDDVRKNDPTTFTKQVYYIPTMFCWGTYDTHKYRTIQKELLLNTKSKSTESNWFNDEPYFNEKDGNKGESNNFIFND